MKRRINHGSIIWKKWIIPQGVIRGVVWSIFLNEDEAIS
jgi:hypothetical protein